ncbi:MAG: hypothetical protein LW834_22905 [Cyanobium sp. 49614_E6]|nr:hypothetical protein [Cyanobium sp. 49614_E6]
MPTFPVPKPSPAPKRKPRPYTPEDIHLLTELAGELPMRLLVAEFNRRRPPRSWDSLRSKAWSMGLSTRSEGKYISTGAIKKLTGHGYDRINYWLDSKQLKYIQSCKPSKGHRFVSRDSLWEFARKHPHQFGGIGHSELTQLHPHQFGGIGHSELTQLFDSEVRASKIVAMNLPRLKHTVEVVCIETGQRYKSIKAASVAAFVNKSGISSSIHKGWAANGLHYRRVVEPAMPNLS